MDLSFAGIHQLVRPYLSELDRLPPPQRDALGTALGVCHCGRTDRFLVGLGALTLLSAVARERPLLCVVDGFQWLDRESAEVIAFVARRLGVDRIGFLIVAGNAVDAGSLAGLPELRLGDSSLGAFQHGTEMTFEYPSPHGRGEQLRLLASAGRQRPAARVLIVDDHRTAADGLRLVFDQHDDLQVVGVASDAATALELAAAARPDVLVVDYRLPDATGPELATRLRERLPDARVLLLGTVMSRPLLGEAVRAGARGYVLETQPADELVDAVRRIAAGEMLIPAGKLAELVTGANQDAQLLDELTARERDVLRLLAAGFDNRGIAAQLGIGYVTVRSHLRNLSSKLDAHSKLEVVARAAELGLIAR
jgi:DNA-binding NarL/FixJ family response regulator